MGHLYRLDGHNTVPVESAEEWAQAFSDRKKRRVARTELGTVVVSTVFLGIDHGFGTGRPVLFETMVFGGEHDEYQERCCTWDEAEAMHARVVGMVRGEW